MVLLGVVVNRWPKWPLRSNSHNIIYLFISPIWVYVQQIVALGLGIKEWLYFDFLPLMTSEFKILQSQMSIDTIRVYMQKSATLSLFVNMWPQLAIFDLGYIKLTYPMLLMGVRWVCMQKITSLRVDFKFWPQFTVFDLWWPQISKLYSL